MARAKAYQQVVLQGILSIVFAAAALLYGVQASYSVLLGGIAVVIPTLLFILCVFHFSGARAAGKMLGSFFVGEFIKLAAMAASIVMVLKWVPVNGLVFLLSFIGVQFFALIINFWIGNKPMVKA